MISCKKKELKRICLWLLLLVILLLFLSSLLLYIFIFSAHILANNSNLIGQFLYSLISYNSKFYTISDKSASQSAQ